MFGDKALNYLINNFQFTSVLDIGCGEGVHSEIFKDNGKKVTSVDLKNKKYIVGNYLDINFEEPFDAIWACHVLEHQLNVNLFLKKVFRDLKEGGVLAVTVPPLKHSIVGGHVTLWNAGLLLYNLVLAGFNCKDAFIYSYGYNISVIIKKEAIKLPELNYDYGDINTLKKFFPDGLSERFDGNIKKLRWTE